MDDPKDLDRLERQLGLAVTVQNLSTRLDEFRAETRDGYQLLRAELKDGLDRLESKVDQNLEAGYAHDAKLEERFQQAVLATGEAVANHEQRLSAVETAVKAEQVVGQRRLSSWQITGIVAGIVVGIGSVFVAVVAVTVSVLVAVLS